METAASFKGCREPTTTSANVNHEPEAHTCRGLVMTSREQKQIETFLASRLDGKGELQPLSWPLAQDPVTKIKKL